MLKTSFLPFRNHRNQKTFTISNLTSCRLPWSFYEATTSDPLDQSHLLEPIPDPPFRLSVITDRLLKKDKEELLLQYTSCSLAALFQLPPVRDFSFTKLIISQPITTVRFDVIFCRSINFVRR